MIVGLGAAGILLPDLVPSVPEPGSPEAIATLVLGGAFYILIALRAARTYLLTRRLADLLVVMGTVVLAAALVPALLMTYMQLGWWLGHLFELIGIGMVAVPVALDLHRGAQSRPLTGDLCGTALVSAADAFLGPTVRVLLDRLAEKDAYTAEHTRNVALRSVAVGQELGLPPARLRELAIGALLHDIGKLSVPDAILQKPGPLSDDEYAVIRRHPEDGHDLVLALGFSRQVARLVRDHHERLDGAGYPNGAEAAGAGPPDAHPHHLRRAGRAALGARLPRGLEPRPRARAAALGVARGLRPVLRAGARAGARGRALGRAARRRLSAGGAGPPSGSRRSFEA